MMPEKATTCCFTGHRASKLPWMDAESDPRCLLLKERIYDAVEAVRRAGVRHYICGMATGGDTYFAEAVLSLRAEHPEITLEAAVPYEGQAERWDLTSKRRWSRIITESDYQTVVQKEYSPDCMMRRNRYMVDSSSVLIAAYNGSPGGTQSTMLYAMREGLEIIEIPVES